MNITVEELVSLMKAIRAEAFKEAAMEARVTGERHEEAGYRMGFTPTIGGATMAIRQVLLALAKGERHTPEEAIRDMGERE